MDNNQIQSRNMTSPAGRNDLAASRETVQLMTLGRKMGWSFRTLGQAPLPTKPVRLGDWLLVPAHMDSTAIPVRTQERIQAVFAAGIRPKGFVLVHEAPMLLAGSRQHSGKPNPNTIPNVDALGALLGAGVAVASALASLASILLPVAFVMGAALLDPILVAVTEDDYWIEIDRWWTE